MAPTRTLIHTRTINHKWTPCDPIYVTVSQREYGINGPDLTVEVMQLDNIRTLLRKRELERIEAREEEEDDFYYCEPSVKKIKV